MKNIYYERPLLELEEIFVERGFEASSLLNYDKTPDMPYGDTGEQWF